MRNWIRTYEPYFIFIILFALFIIVAFVTSTPQQLFLDLTSIITSRSVLITDYIAEGSIGATLLNVAIVGGVTLIMLFVEKIRPDGAVIMGLWLTIGFAFFGKNIFNMIPITFGVWLCAKIQNEPYEKYVIIAMLSATVSPIVSEIAFLGQGNPLINIFIGILTGILTGLIFPFLSAFCTRIHDGYMLYNLGFAGGIISLIFLSVLRAFDIDIEPKYDWSTGNNLSLSIFIFVICIAFIIYGLKQHGFKKVKSNLIAMTKHSGRLATDYYNMFGASSYVNVGLLGILGTLVVLVLGADINGPTIAGIFCIMGFGFFGKNLKNVPPIMIGAIACSLVNPLAVTAPSNILAILFGTGLAPIAGKYGFWWGVVAGFIHVNLILHVGILSRGVNLYNNGFVAGFVALFLVPIINGLIHIYHEHVRPHKS